MTNLVSLIFKHTQLLIRVSFTVIFLAYFLVWLPQPAVGLSFIGLDIGEWVKFLPQVRQGELLPTRDFFYLPPAILGALIAVWTSGWPNRRWQTWAARGSALLIATLIFPSIESILDEPTEQWIWRILFIGLTPAAIVLAARCSSMESVPKNVPWLPFLLLGLVGAILPLWTYLAVKPHVEAIFAADVGYGIGLVLNALGFGLLVALGLFHLYQARSISAEKQAETLNLTN